MKTILVDAKDTFTVDGKVNRAMHKLLEKYTNRKIIVTNANNEEVGPFGLVDLPYSLFTLNHEPNKVDSEYFSKMLEHFGLSPDEVIYFEHNKDAVKSAESVGIVSYYYDHRKKNLRALKKFLDKNL